MPIPESQLETWSKQGSISQSASTYQTIRGVLEAATSGFSDKSFEIFLQGSYGNDTNIYADSDVDVVICLNSIFRYDLERLHEDQKAEYKAWVTPATYSFQTFKTAVVTRLEAYFGKDYVKVGTKAITIQGKDNRRDADVVVCWEYRAYTSFILPNTEDYVKGIIFPSPNGEIINFPKQHSSNLTQKHQETHTMLKPMVRILKNMRNSMIDSGALAEGIAPSYYLEGLFYNIPASEYDTSSYGNTFCNGINWILQHEDAAKLVCPNWRYYLLGTSNVQWNRQDFDAFLEAACKLWKEW